jgi:hypothetical protein
MARPYVLSVTVTLRGSLVNVMGLTGGTMHLPRLYEKFATARVLVSKITAGLTWAKRGTMSCACSMLRQKYEQG